MAVDADLLARAYSNPKGLTLDELVQLTLSLGWQEARQKGSHRIFVHPEAAKVRRDFPQPLNYQPVSNGMAKAYQVNQMLRMAEALGKIQPPSKGE